MAYAFSAVRRFLSWNWRDQPFKAPAATPRAAIPPVLGWTAMALVLVAIVIVFAFLGGIAWLAALNS